MAFRFLAAFFLGCITFPLSPSFSCSTDTFLQKSRICVNNFFDSLKQRPSGNCSAYYGQLLNCTKQELVRFLNQSECQEMSASILSRAQQITATQKYFCEDGMLNSLDQYHRSQLPYCQKKFFKKAQKCSLSFREIFRDDKGSNSLCRKYSKAKKCLKRALGKFCEKNKEVDRLVSLYEQPYNPYCPGRVDQKQRRTKSPGGLDYPFGVCTTRSYLLLTRICVARFVKTLQKSDDKSCRLAFMNKLEPCVKGILIHCLKDTYKSTKALNKNIDASLARNREYQQHNYCYGKGLSLPALEKNQCKTKYLRVKEKCEEDYVEAYRENKADESLCQKYSRAKKCTKNATLVLCRVTPQLQDEVEFLYDRFNPFCFNLTDPPMQTAPRITRNPQGPKEQTENAPIRGDSEDTGTPSGDGSKSSSKTVPNGSQSGTTPWLGYVMLLTILTALFGC